MIKEIYHCHFKHKFAGNLKGNKLQECSCISGFTFIFEMEHRSHNLFLPWKARMNESMNLANIKVYLEFVGPDFIKTLESERLEHYQKFANPGIKIHPWLLSVSSPSFHIFTVQLLWIEAPKYLSNPYTSLRTRSHHSCPSQCHLLLQLLQSFLGLWLCPLYPQFHIQPG